MVSSTLVYAFSLLEWRLSLVALAFNVENVHYDFHVATTSRKSFRALKSPGTMKMCRVAKRSKFISASFASASLSNSDHTQNSTTVLDVDDLWDAQLVADSAAIEDIPSTTMYRSSRLASPEQWETFIRTLERQTNKSLTTTLHHDSRSHLEEVDLFWEQIKHEAEMAVVAERQAGPQLYQGILSQPTLLSAICTVISHEIETELIPATTLKGLFIDLLTSKDIFTIRQDLQAVTSRDPSIETAMEAILFHKGFHALVCYRVGHRLWQAQRTGLAYYMQSTVSRIYSADIHPACTMGSGIYLRVGVGVVIGETAVVGNDVSICEGVTLGGTGKESGDRHPKVGNGVTIYGGGTILGNIPIGEGSIVSAKSIVTKPLPPLAIVSGVPATIRSYRTLQESEFGDNLQNHLVIKYLDRWRAINDERLANLTMTK
jgi:serine O-acetyltransferase